MQAGIEGRVHPWVKALKERRQKAKQIKEGEQKTGKQCGHRVPENLPAECQGGCWNTAQRGKAKVAQAFPVHWLRGSAC